VSLPITIPLIFTRLQFISGGELIAPLSDQEAVHLQNLLQPMQWRYLRELEAQVGRAGNLEVLLSEIIPEPILQDEIELEFPGSTDEISYPPFQLRFTVLLNEGPNQYWGLVPAIGLEAVAPDAEQLFQRLDDGIRLHFNRIRGKGFLEKAIAATWYDQVDIMKMEAPIQVPSLVERTQDTNNANASWLLRVAQPLVPSPDPVAFGRSTELQQLQRAMRNPYAKSCILIGPSGVGKSALIYEMVRRQKTGSPQVWETTAARLIKELTGETGWQDTIMFLLKDLQRLGGTLYVRQLRELFEIGQYEGNDVSLGEFLIPSLARGELTLLSECTLEDRIWIERKSPGFFTNLQQVHVRPPQGNQAVSMVNKKIRQQAETMDLKVFPAATEEALDLHHRFFPYSGEPGQTIRFLENLIQNNAPENGKINRSAVVHYFSRQSGIPAEMIDPKITFQREEVRSYFANQLFGQDAAIDGVTDMLGAVKNQLIRSDKPIASFLFIGPTGVGKTELAKILAQYMFGDRERMQRFDMSEFASPSAVYRLTGMAGGLLTSAIRRNPFCVLLFDELEKAHPNFYDLLLQMLGEGRLTGNNGRMVNFCSTIIIMTSNIGATAGERASISLQQNAPQQVWRDHYLRAVQKHLRPELINRIDRIIPFDPLSPEVMQQVVEREIGLLKRREGILHRRIDLSISPEVLQLLATKGYDERLGARQLQRVLREDLVIPLARALNEAPPDEHLMVELESDGAQPVIQVETDPLNMELWLEEYEKVSLVNFIAGQRRDFQLARQSNLYIHFLSELDILERSKKFNESTFWADKTGSRRYAELSKCREKFDSLQKQIDELEEDISLANFGILPYRPETMNQYESWNMDFLDLRWEVYDTLYPGSSDTHLSVFGKNPRLLAEFYEELFTEFELDWTVELLKRIPGDPHGGLERVLDEPLEEEDWDQVFGWMAAVSGRGVHFLLCNEQGLTEWQEVNKSIVRYWVDVSQSTPDVPNDLIRKDAFANKVPRRIIRPNHLKDQSYNINREYDREGPVPLIIPEIRGRFSQKVEELWQ
jgi:ATP-dependent Clp protease ATP-binding subunit ClpA